MSDIKITVSGERGKGKSEIIRALRRFMINEGYAVSGTDQLKEFLDDGQLSDKDIEDRNQRIESIKQNIEVTFREQIVSLGHDFDFEILDKIRERRVGNGPAQSTQKGLTINDIPTKFNAKKDKR